MNKIKTDWITYWADRGKATSVTKGFYKKHWKGEFLRGVLVSTMSIVIVQAMFDILWESSTKEKQNNAKEIEA